MLTANRPKQCGRGDMEPLYVTVTSLLYKTARKPWKIKEKLKGSNIFMYSHETYMVFAPMYFKLLHTSTTQHFKRKTLQRTHP